MKIYLVRHGETEGNIAHRHQVDKTPLTPAGREQALRTAEALKQYQPTHLLTSKLVRAIETARVIGEVCNLTPETSTHFVELARPSNLYGRHHKSLSSLIFYARWYFGLIKSADGETYQALRDRILVARSELVQYPSDARVVVVSHAAFLTFFLAHLCRQKPLFPYQAFKVFMNILTMKNGAITELEFDEASPAGECPWRVVTHEG